MTPEARTLLRRDVMVAEGLRLKPYRDTVNKLTIGYGRNLDDVGISALEAEVLLDHDLAGAEIACRQAFDWYTALNEVRQRVIVELAFNLGIKGLSKFNRTIASIRLHNYQAAAAQLLDSKWAGQVGPTRAGRLARMLRDGRT